MKVLVGFILCLIMLAIGGVIYIYSGTYDVSALNRDEGVTRWILETTMDNSVKRHAKTIEIPSLDDSTMILRGYAHYSRMCGCHGSPGRESNRAYNPEPPELYKTASEWEPNELFWIVKNGIKMTGMPSFAKRSSDEEIWDMVAFLRILPKVTPEQYKAMDVKARSAGFIEKR
jgi:mono/diheme cytochrome c family protein